MSKTLYIVGLLYFPLIIAFMIFANGSLIWDKFYFVLEKSLLCTALFFCFERELIQTRKRILLSLLVLNIIFLGYIVIDWEEVYNMNIYAVAIASSIYIICLLLNLIYHDRKR